MKKLINFNESRANQYRDAIQTRVFPEIVKFTELYESYFNEKAPEMVVKKAILEDSIENFLLEKAEQLILNECKRMKVNNKTVINSMKSSIFEDLTMIFLQIESLKKAVFNSSIPVYGCEFSINEDGKPYISDEKWQTIKEKFSIFIENERQMDEYEAVKAITDSINKYNSRSQKRINCLYDLIPIIDFQNNFAEVNSLYINTLVK